MIRLRKLREEKGITQMALSESSGVAQSVISDIECGVIKKPSIWVVSKLAKALGVTIQDFIDENATA